MPRKIKPIKIYGGYFGPNPHKTCIILSELELPYETEFIDFSDLKTPSYESINPNGRLPAIYDPNTDITLWESGAIIEYLIETYDQNHRLSFAPGTKEWHHTRQWLYYQVSGQGPYYGQAVWFKRYHEDHIDSAIQRYVNEMKRVSKVLDRWLEHREWLVGDKLTYADLAFITWQNAAQGFLSEEGFNQNEFPHMLRWLKQMNERPIVRDIIEKQEKVLKDRMPQPRTHNRVN
ncbi:hypothetical protein PISL3812_07581 [Talaromyces islandicus]|uniref:glutathione transferase n=1 Tax=Talaromyces islandicus TaxID=28573 RepID=A0A0U1M4R9_TALIS|nr:hypothetical protein PISL3812_07581 [Talaromyces islandicus]